MANTPPNAEEKALFQKIAQTVKEQTFHGKGADVCQESPRVAKLFQDLAKEVRDLIEKQGESSTTQNMLNLSKSLKLIKEKDLNNANVIYGTFSRFLTVTKVVQRESSPSSKPKLF